MKTLEMIPVIDRLPVVLLDSNMRHNSIKEKLTKTKLSAVEKVLSKRAGALLSRPNSSFSSMEKIDRDTYMASLTHMLRSIKDRRTEARYDESNDETIPLCLALWYGYFKGYLLANGYTPDLASEADVVLFTEEVVKFINDNNIIKFYNCFDVAVDSFLERSAPIYPGYYAKTEILLSLWYLVIHSDIMVRPLISYSLSNTRHVDGTPLEELLCQYLYR